MALLVREMLEDEFEIPINYFHNATVEHLQIMGVGPEKLPPREKWLAYVHADMGNPIEQRSTLQLLWLSDGEPIGFSTADTIIFGESAKMHLHVLDPSKRQKGYGTECVRRSADIYFERLRLQKLYCEPRALNVAPNRTLQNAGFKYLKTHETIPGYINTLQMATLWLREKQ